MTEIYEPSSEFLRAITSGDVPLSGSSWAESNLCRLVAMTHDADRSNRDWATFLLSQADLDTSDVREALLQATEDDDENVRAEAIWGLAKRDRELALPLVHRALSAGSVTVPIIEAAALVAHSSLVADLLRFSAPSDRAYLDELIQAALTACQTGQSTAL